VNLNFPYLSETKTTLGDARQLLNRARVPMAPQPDGPAEDVNLQFLAGLQLQRLAKSSWE
jgi:hypothetical protein